MRAAPWATSPRRPRRCSLAEESDDGARRAIRAYDRLLDAEVFGPELWTVWTAVATYSDLFLDPGCSERLATSDYWIRATSNARRIGSIKRKSRRGLGYVWATEVGGRGQGDAHPEGVHVVMAAEVGAGASGAFCTKRWSRAAPDR